MASSGEAVALRGQSPSPLSRSSSLQATAAVNAGLHQEETRRSPISAATRNRQFSHTGRRRSNVIMNLQLNDPSVPGPGEMVTDTHQSSYSTASPNSLSGSPIISSGDPHHLRNPSLGEIHQELEQEQEAQVNRLLQMIRTQQQQLQQLQAAGGQNTGAPSAIDESTPTSERSMSFSNPNALPAPLPSAAIPAPRSPSAILHPRSSFDLARSDLQRRTSRAPSRTTSPALRSTSISGDPSELLTLGGRDESAFYQAETQMVIRENQMLRQRIRELERQVSELNANSASSHEPAVASHLLRSTSVSEEPTVPVPVAVEASSSEEMKGE